MSDDDMFIPGKGDPLLEEDPAPRTCMELFVSTGFSRRSPPWPHDRSRLFGAGRAASLSRRLRSGSRSARKGSGGRNGSGGRRAALAELVFRSTLTPEHSEGG